METKIIKSERDKMRKGLWKIQYSQDVMKAKETEGSRQVYVNRKTERRMGGIAK